MYRVGVVGLHHPHARLWIQTLGLFSERLKVVAIYEPNATTGRSPDGAGDGVAEALDAPMVASLEQMVSDHEVDIALVTLPNRDAPAVIEFLGRAGVHMIVDKPAAKDAPAARQAFDAAAAGGARVLAGLTRRYSPVFLAMRDAVSSGKLGMTIAASSMVATSSIAVRGPNSFLFSADASGGGILSWLGIHEIDLLIWMLGSVSEVTALTASWGNHEADVEDVSSVSLRFENGSIATLHHGYVLPARGHRAHFVIHGTEGTAEMGSDESAFALLTAGEDGAITEERYQGEVVNVGGYGADARSAVADLLSAIEEARDPIASGRELVTALEVVDAAYESSRTGRVVRVGQPLPSRP